MSFIRDLRYALRGLARTPSFTVAALLVVALGIGATTAVFTVVRAVLLRPLPYRDVDSLVIFRVDGPGVVHAPALTGEEFFALRERTDVFEAVATVNESQASITGVDDMEVITAASVSDNFLPLLGVSPFLGRQVNAREDIGKPYIRAVNVGYELWQRRWHGDPSLIGRHIEINNIDVAVVGIMPPGFRTYLGSGTNLAERIDVWFPGAPDFTPTSRNVPGISRLRRGVSIEAAQRETDSFVKQFAATHAANYRLGPVRFTLAGLQDDLVHDVLPALVALAGAVAFVLIVACANLMNLLLARGCARAREFGIRIAIGASRAHVAAQLATESIVLWLIGSIAGLIVAAWGVDTLLQLAPAALPRRETIHIDVTVAMFAVGVSLVCALLFGLWPAWQATKQDVTATVKHDPASAPGAAVTRGLLLAGQLALSLVLLVGAGLMARAFVSLRHVPLGFDPSRVLTMTLDARAFSANSTPEQRLNGYLDAAEAARAVPGVEAVGVGLPVPLTNTRLSQRYSTTTDGGAEHLATEFIALPGYAEAMRVPLRAGRFFTRDDFGSAKAVVMIDERLAAETWPAQTAVGHRLMLVGAGTAPRQEAEIVGVVAHVQAADLRGDTRGQIWVTYPTRLFFQMGLAVRTHGDPLPLATAVRQAVERLGPRRPVTNVSSLDAYVSAASADTRFALTVLGAFAVLAVLQTRRGRLKQTSCRL